MKHWNLTVRNGSIEIRKGSGYATNLSRCFAVTLGNLLQLRLFQQDRVVLLDSHASGRAQGSVGGEGDVVLFAKVKQGLLHEVSVTFHLEKEEGGRRNEEGVVRKRFPWNFFTQDFFPRDFFTRKKWAIGNFVANKKSDGKKVGRRKKSTCRLAGLMRLLSRMCWICLWLKLDRPIAFTKPWSTAFSNSWIEMEFFSFFSHNEHGNEVRGMHVGEKERTEESWYLPN